ncbi:GDSL-like Lipase/Acylhydrolase family protein [Sphingomonas guangdongensis]|uniref:GDSL-like Lipase/Acylhydrolase family protein n=1 Tax=Sphingomonas guangdongensis TaxID=1141890 RepID=A0A285QHY9_9SPHN|nr:SGNH/GDSL hydrolase family protein [Sphingomonas guangdongensis]SOB81094.1 GDSL-like Lipase/Acylhydrolase family protein [Sphingomonas guangdongensis]
MLDLSLSFATLNQSDRDLDASAPPPPLPTYLPVLATQDASYHLVTSTERLMPGYAGPLVNAGGLDLGGERVSPAAVQAARGEAEAIRIATLYDQTGSGRNYTQLTAPQQFALSDLVRIGIALPVIVDGRRSDGAGGVFRAMSAPAALTGRGFTRALVMEPTASIIPQLLGAVGGHLLYTYSLGPTDSPGYGSVEGGKVQLTAGGAVFDKMPASPCVLMLRERADGCDLFFNGARVASAAVPSAEALTTLSLGANTGLETFNPNVRVLADVVVAGTLSDADCIAVDGALRDRFDIAPWGTNARVLLIGDSIAEGVATTLTRGIGHYARPLIDEATDWYVFANARKFLAHCYRDSVAYEGQVDLPSSGRPIVSVIQGGINDIHAGGSGGATLYTDTTIPYVAYLKSLGHKVVVCTLLPQTANVSPAIEAERQAYNTAVRANGAGATAACDLASNAAMGSYPAATGDPTLYPNGIHPSSLGYSHLAATYAAAINAVLL